MRRFTAVLLLLILLTGCAAPAQTSGGPVTGDPTDGWETAAPGDQGLDAARLRALPQAVADRRLSLDSLLVVHQGVIVFEEYFDGERPANQHEMYSVTKSFTSTLAGLAIADGHLSGVDARVVDLLPASQTADLDPELRAMTVADLLTMRTGWDWQEGDPAYRALFMSGDWVRYMFDLPASEAPGERFNYCSGCSHVLMAVIEEQLGMDARKYAAERLFAPLGITQYRWETDAQGIAIGGWGLGLTARDMAKFGYLFLHDGQWGGEQIVPAEWVKDATTPWVDQSGRLDYGYQWWIDTNEAAYAALGRDGQMIYVDPGSDLVVVITAQNPGNHDLLLELIDEFIRPALPED